MPLDFFFGWSSAADFLAVKFTASANAISVRFFQTNTGDIFEIMVHEHLADLKTRFKLYSNKTKSVRLPKRDEPQRVI